MGVCKVYNRLIRVNVPQEQVASLPPDWGRTRPKSTAHEGDVTDFLPACFLGIIPMGPKLGFLEEQANEICRFED